MDDYPETPMESDDVFPCKGCGEVSLDGIPYVLVFANTKVTNIINSRS